MMRNVNFAKEMAMATVKINSSNFQSDVLQSSEPVVVDFWAEWCGPCKMIAPALEEIATEMAGQIKVAKINVDENPELAAQFGIRSIPTLLMFKDGQVASNMVGAAPKNRLSDWIKGAVA
jgi:thioredoxin 1